MHNLAAASWSTAEVLERSRPGLLKTAGIGSARGIHNPR